MSEYECVCVCDATATSLNDTHTYEHVHAPISLNRATCINCSNRAVSYKTTRFHWLIESQNIFHLCVTSSFEIFVVFV